MQTVIALVGRPNVGKSTLFNRLTRSRDALVADIPGLTRDRKYGLGQIGQGRYMVVDTGGLGEESDTLDALMREQSRLAMEEATHIIFLLDGQVGITAGDEELAHELRILGKPVTLAVNKSDRADRNMALAEAARLGLGEPRLISARQGGAAIEEMVNAIVPESSGANAGGMEETRADAPIRIAFVGRPNVGKSTLINRILGEERVVVFDHPGTTRDTIDVPFERDGQAYTLIDTAGVRRRAKINETVEKFSVVKTLEAIRRADVVVLVLDAKTGVSEQDAHLLGLIVDAGAALVVAINKWDHLSPEQRTAVRRGLDLKLAFLDFAERHFISALHGTGVGNLFPAILDAYASMHREVGTSQLNRILEGLVEAHQPPMSRGRRIKLRYAHLGGHRPFTIVIHGNQTERLPGAYKRYLANGFRRALKLVGTPVVLEFKTGENPYAGKRNVLTPRQERSRARLMRHTKRRK